MQLYEQIRRVRERELSIRELSRRFGVHRRDVRAALESAVPPPRKAPQRSAPKMDEFKAVIDAWLEVGPCVAAQAAPHCPASVATLGRRA